MKITGPFLDPAKKGQPKPWYLRVAAPAKNKDGTVILNEKGRAILKRHRPYYETKAKAEADKPALAAQYGAAGAETSGGILSRAQAAEYEEAKALAPEVPLPDLARFWRLHHPLTKVAKIGELSPIFLAELETLLGKKTRGWQDLNSRVPQFARAFAERIPETITRDEFLSWLLGLGKKGRTVKNLKASVVRFFNWLVQKRHLKTNPLAGIKKRELPKAPAKEIEYLPLEYVRRYLRACERYDPELVAHEVIQLLAGVRSDDEMANFDGKWVLPQTREVVIPAEIAKIDARREVIGNLEDGFWVWWEKYGRKGILRPKNYRKRWKRIRLLTTLEDAAEADRLAAQPFDAIVRADRMPAALRGWPWNARRRTFCTYHVALHQSADKTALILRHRGEASTLHNSYRGLGATQAQGREYFAILPEPVAAPILPAQRPRRARAAAPEAAA